MTDQPRLGSDDATVLAAARALRRGGLVGLPTETVYGLAANAFDATAVARVFEVKGRPSFDPLIVHVADAADVLPLFAVPLSPVGVALAAAFWPGPLTLVAERSALVPDIVTAGLSTVAVRVPAHPLARAVIRAAGVPLAAPSANRFGEVSPTTAAHVIAQLGDAVSVVVDGGACEVGVESTIVSIATEPPTVLRFGGIGLEAIEAVIGEVAQRLHSTDRPEAPGQLSRHYATGTPIHLLELGASPSGAPDRGLLVLQGVAPESANGYGVVEVLSPSGDLRRSAQRLFAAMRELDTASLSAIDVLPCENAGLGRAILDRVRRASVAGAAD